MADFRINTEVHKREREVVLYMTQGEATQVPYEVYVLNNQEPLDLTGTIVEYRATLPNGTFLNQLISTNDIDSKKGKINWLPDSRLTQAHGKITVSQFVITKGDRNIRTRDIVIDVTSTPDMTDKAAEVIMTQIDELKESVIEIDNEVTVVGDKVNEIKDEITNHPDKFRGLKGDRGIQGVQGVRGVQGETGEQGVQGVRGLKGETGEQGIRGEKGDTGDVSLEQLNSVINYFTPQQGKFNAINELSGAVFNWVMSANTITLMLAYRNNKAFDNGDVHIGNLPAGLPLPSVYSVRNTFANVSGKTAGANTVGSIRIYSDGKIVMNWDEAFAGGVDQYLEFGLTYISDRKFNEPVVVVGAEN